MVRTLPRRRTRPVRTSDGVVTPVHQRGVARVRDGGGRPALEMPEDESVTLTIGQAAKGRPDPVPRLFADSCLLGRGLFARERDVFHAIALSPKPPPPTRAPAIPTRVDGHPRQPRGPVARRTGLTTCLMKLEKHVLHDLSALVAVGEQQPAQAVETPRVLLEELLIGRRASRDGRSVTDQHVQPP